jgi:hypothetical protein
MGIGRWLERRLFGVERRVLDARAWIVDLDRGAVLGPGLGASLGDSAPTVLAWLGAPDERSAFRRGVWAYRRIGLILDVDEERLTGLAACWDARAWYGAGAGTPWPGRLRWQGREYQPRDISEDQVRALHPAVEEDRDEEELVLSVRLDGIHREWEFFPDGTLKYAGVFLAK